MSAHVNLSCKDAGDGKAPTAVRVLTDIEICSTHDTHFFPNVLVLEDNSCGVSNQLWQRLQCSCCIGGRAHALLVNSKCLFILFSLCFRTALSFSEAECRLGEGHGKVKQYSFENDTCSIDEDFPK